ncbi:MAG: cell envelope integrity protein CreD, partial [Acidobacteria bacterium]|nr:cell envelope integrity protein CreD [Acidobacteriota bacterium]
MLLLPSFGRNSPPYLPSAAIVPLQRQCGMWVMENNVRTSALSKLAVVAGIFFVLLVPIILIYSLVAERTSRRDEASDVISGEWGQPQVISGPVLTVPFSYTVAGKNGQQETLSDRAVFLPEVLQIDAELTTEIRKRSLFGVPVYRARLRLTGHFKPPDVGTVFSRGYTVSWKEARLSMAVSDPRGIAGPVGLVWNGSDQNVTPGVAEPSLGAAGVSAAVTGLENQDGKTLPFALTLELNGTKTLQVVPLGDNTTVAMRSPWPHPGFQGAPLPVKHTIGADGFTADWSVPYFGRGFPSAWRRAAMNQEQLTKSIHYAAFGVTLVQPVDIYQQTTRAVKYAAIFIVMTFVIAFLWEIIGGVMVHPVQYLFIGFALCLFYVLLLAISEHAGFDTAYALSAGPTVALIAWYWQWVVQARGRAALMLAALTALYSYLYLLLRLEDYALLAGALGLFFMLAVVMFLTRRVNWYTLQPGH